MTGSENNSKCGDVFDRAAAERCKFVQDAEVCQHLESRLDVAEFLFCTFGDDAFLLPIVLLIIIGIFLIYLLNLFITKFFVDTTLSIGRRLNLNEYLTGVVVVTIANTLYNFYILFQPKEPEAIEIYGTTVGTALICIGVVLPVIIIMKPHLIIKEYMMIDCLFIIINYVWLKIYFEGQEINRLQSVVLACGYVFYIVILWIDSRYMRWRYTFQYVKPERLQALIYAKMPFKIFSNMNHKRMHTDEEDKFFVKARRYAEWFNPAERGPANKYIFKQFKDDLLEFHYTGVSKFIKIKRMIDTPFVVLFRFVVPVIDFRKPCHKWSKLLRIINVILYPLACYYAMGLHLVYINYVFYATLVLAFLIFCTSRTDRAPEYYSFYGLCSFIGYTFITFGIMNEVENIISLMFMLWGFESKGAGLLAVAIFDVVPDLSLAINLVQRGYPKIAWAGCFATVIFRGYFEIGIRFFIRVLRDLDTTIPRDDMASHMTSYGIIQILYLCFGLEVTNYFSRRSLAYFLIIMYAFILFYFIYNTN